jgi:hypothetical protein
MLEWTVAGCHTNQRPDGPLGEVTLHTQAVGSLTTPHQPAAAVASWQHRTADVPDPSGRLLYVAHGRCPL